MHSLFLHHISVGQYLGPASLLEKWTSTNCMKGGACLSTHRSLSMDYPKNYHRSENSKRCRASNHHLLNGIFTVRRSWTDNHHVQGSLCDFGYPDGYHSIRKCRCLPYLLRSRCGHCTIGLEMDILDLIPSEKVIQGGCNCSPFPLRSLREGGEKPCYS